ncbi:MAG: hypothetical protein COW00_10175 [Bdellovibrio sp. CG12_big_fil_rev_8_21_14_0_65_39_13]|nr:MAG: hypothetical protein COW78_01140 [Bdellovibrio sp. CG22_combo_CG10-13_8_21_14_all_39_27]PIQ59477.1 MAG: hypothetical protein COW00_10175 [Bdellovibrio sp. CG12_big_fil_rev_8_21_14_0_65_39_13]PIR36607.1 MAG: hypothetical protein COV37_02905 [Bdellovibrio sp. CG11_big_fil_rev_8_21_14_0_20_39_38]
MTNQQKKQWLEKLSSLGIMDSEGKFIAGSEAQLYKLLDNEFVENRLELDRLNLSVETIPCTISWVNNKGEYVGVNHTLAEICGLPIEDFVGKPIGFYTRNRFFSNFSELLFQSSETSVYQEIETDINQHVRRYWVVGTKFDENKQAIIIGIDITEIKHLEDSVSFMDKLSSLGEMVAGIVHEINNPLQLISVENQRVPLLLKKGEMEKVVQGSEKIHKTISKITRIIAGVKNFVRQGQKDPDVEFKISQVIDDAVVLCEGKFKQSDVKISVECPAHFSVKSNYTQVFQIFTNLFTNAVDAIEKLEEKWIKVEVIDTDKDLKIKIIDSGPGISAEIVDDIFKSFFTTKGLGKGTGLGLSLSKKIAIEQGGDLTVLHDEPHTTFCLSLPKAAA